MQWGGGVNTTSIKNKHCGYFHQVVHVDVSPRNFNERHMLDKENNRVRKWGAGFEE